ncbi:MAG: pyruvate dehydrogenase complex dihydrolipoamide acetyltransferase [Chitinophagaceae bacterium]|nr:pyruvate dehydrogenase complex dihydrolipoamide acetyltransferase [Chitinophagaceae bacterium]
MAEAIRMPRMSDTMTEGIIVSWQKKVGDKIKPGDVLAEVETDKATMELESYNEGTILYIGPKKGDKVPVDNVIAVVGKEGESYEGLLQENNKKETAAPTKEEAVPAATAPANAELPKGAKVIRMPLMSDTMTEGKIVKWLKKVGDKVKSDDALLEVETDKATMEVVGYEEGTLLHIAVEAGDAAPINAMIAIVGPEGTDVSAYVAAQKAQPAGGAAAPAAPSAPAATSSTPALAPTQSEASADDDGRIKASPLARKMAKEKGISLSLVKGTGDGGRIIKRDIDNYVPAAAPAVSAPAESPKEGALHIHEFAPVGQEGYTDIPNNSMRLTIARRLGESKFNAPHFYLTMEINMDQAMAARKAMNEVSPVKISFNDIVIKAVAMALREHPAVNSSWMGDFIRQNHHIHIGSAVAMPDGLIVPVIRFADQKSLAQIASEAKGLYEKARNKKLQPNEFSGNTFTISNLGMMDIDEFTAIINPPDSAILAVGRIKEVVVRKGDGFGVTNIMKVTLSCDHRSVDGAVGAAFLQTVKAFLENPVRMLI